MTVMHPVLAALPVLAVGVSALILRRPALQAAVAGAAVAVATAFWRLGPAEPAMSGPLGESLVLALTAAAVIFPGLMFVEATQRGGAAEALGTWIQHLPVNRGVSAALLVAGLGPFVESLTGFGVSLVVMVPAALALMPRATALRTALVGVNVMPWGTLGLATLVGAQLAGVDAGALGRMSALTSSAVFPAAALVACILAGQRGWGRLAAAASIGSVFSVGLWAGNAAIGPSVAGALAGLSVTALGVAACHLAPRRAPLPPRAAWPFAALFAGALVHRAFLALWPALAGIDVTVGDVAWAPLNSPGVPLAAATVAAAPRELATTVRKGAGRAAKPIATLVVFLTMAQAMQHSGATNVLASVLYGVGEDAALAVAAAVGALSAVITGSNVGANALAMGAAAGHGDEAGAPLLFAAVQNSAAGHAVLAAVPIVALLGGLAKASAGEEAALLRFAFGMAAANAFLVAGAATVIRLL